MNDEPMVLLPNEQDAWTAAVAVILGGLQACNDLPRGITHEDTVEGACEAADEIIRQRRVRAARYIG